MKQVSQSQAAEVVGVSTATIRNWAKAGHITPVSHRPLAFLEQDIIDLTNQIGTASFARLKARANKAGAATRLLPEEYSENHRLAGHIADVVDLIDQNQLAIEPVMFLATIRLLMARGEVRKMERGRLFCLAGYASWQREAVRAVMLDWASSFAGKFDDDRYAPLFAAITPDEYHDFLGLLYQSIRSIGNKSEHGSYYTPTRLVDDSLSRIEGQVKIFLDPCCGTGKYLLCAASKFKLAPVNIVGFDTDRIAVNVARINLLLAYAGQEFSPNIYHLDALSDAAFSEIPEKTLELLKNIDVIATNPPWGARKNSSRKQNHAGTVRSRETFSMFLERSIQLLRPNGRVSFILPASILHIKAHTDIRQEILNETTILRITMLGRRFSGVFTPVIRLDLEKVNPPSGWLVSVEQDGKTTEISQERFRNNIDHVFDVSTEAHEADLLEKIYAIEHDTLRGNAEWALGIVTGNNNKHVLGDAENGAEVIYRGTDVCPYILAKPTSYIRFTPEFFQQTAPVKVFRAPEKLVYKFISNNLVVAYDDLQRLTLNSANIVIPSIPGMHIKVALAFLNSTVFRYIFRKKFSTHKVLRRDLERLPFPRLNGKTHNTLEQLVDNVLMNKDQTEEIDEIIFALFGLNREEARTIRQTVADRRPVALRGSE